VAGSNSSGRASSATTAARSQSLVACASPEKPDLERLIVLAEPSEQWSNRRGVRSNHRPNHSAAPVEPRVVLSVGRPVAKVRRFKR
jgi:hypothetical protein